MVVKFPRLRSMLAFLADCTGLLLLETSGDLVALWPGGAEGRAV